MSRVEPLPSPSGGRATGRDEAQPAVVGSGCLFHHVCAEFKEADAPLRQAVRDHKRRVAEHLEAAILR